MRGRFPLVLPVVLSNGNGEFTALTRNVSASGVLFVLDRELKAGLSIRFSLRMPGAVPGNPARCTGSLYGTCGTLLIKPT